MKCLKVVSGATLTCLVAGAVSFAGNGAEGVAAKQNEGQGIFFDKFLDFLWNVFLKLIRLAVLAVGKLEGGKSTDIPSKYADSFHKAFTMLEDFNRHLDKFKKECLDILDRPDEYKKDFLEYEKQRLENEDKKVSLDLEILKNLENIESDDLENLKIVDSFAKKNLQKESKISEEVRSKAKAFEKFMEKRGKAGAGLFDEFYKKNGNLFGDIIRKIDELRELKDESGISASRLSGYYERLNLHPETAKELAKFVDEPEGLPVITDVKSYFKRGGKSVSDSSKSSKYSRESLVPSLGDVKSDLKIEDKESSALSYQDFLSFKEQIASNFFNKSQ